MHIEEFFAGRGSADLWVNKIYEPGSQRADLYSSLDQKGRIFVVLALATMLSWLGEAIHNAIELPGSTVLSPENSVPGLVAAILFGATIFSPFKRTSLVLLLGWSLLNLVGGGVISVLPFSFNPFMPAQNVTHYLAHVLYGIAELPLVLTTTKMLRVSKKTSEEDFKKPAEGAQIRCGS